MPGGFALGIPRSFPPVILRGVTDLHRATIRVDTLSVGDVAIDQAILRSCRTPWRRRRGAGSEGLVASESSSIFVVIKSYSYSRNERSGPGFISVRPLAAVLGVVTHLWTSPLQGNHRHRWAVTIANLALKALCRAQAFIQERIDSIVGATKMFKGD